MRELGLPVTRPKACHCRRRAGAKRLYVEAEKEINARWRRPSRGLFYRRLRIASEAPTTEELGLETVAATLSSAAQSRALVLGWCTESSSRVTIGAKVDGDFVNFWVYMRWTRTLASRPSAGNYAHTRKMRPKCVVL